MQNVQKLTPKAPSERKCNTHLSPKILPCLQLAVPGTPRVTPGFAWDRLGSLGIAWDRLGSPAIAWEPLGWLGMAWARLGPLGIAWDRLGSPGARPGIAWDRWGSLEIAWDRLGSPGIAWGSLGIAWGRLGSLGITWHRLGSLGIAGDRLGSLGLGSFHACILLSLVRPGFVTISFWGRCGRQQAQNNFVTRTWPSWNRLWGGPCHRNKL